VEVVRQANQAFNRDPAGEAALSLLHPALVWEENSTFYPGLEPVYRGHDGYLRWLRQAVIEPFQEVAAVTNSFEDLGDEVLTRTRVRGVGRGSGVKVEMLIFTLFLVRDGKVARRRIYHTRDEAFEAAGLRE
jgi:ketosteroid isomerase-like protein